MCLAYLCRHAPYCLQYLEQVRNHQNFRFCAIPQIMAIGTLSLCYNNPKVFAGEVTAATVHGLSLACAKQHACLRLLLLGLAPSFHPMSISR